MDGVAKDILNPHVVCVTEDMEWRRAAELLKGEAITGAPIVDHQGQVGWGSSRRAISSPMT